MNTDDRALADLIDRLLLASPIDDDTTMIAVEPDDLRAIRDRLEAFHAKPRMYPDDGLKEPVHEFRHLAEDAIKESFAARQSPPVVEREAIDVVDRARQIAQESYDAIRPTGGKFWGELDDMTQTLAIVAARDAILALTPVEGVGEGDVSHLDDRDIFVELREAANLLELSGDLDLRDAVREASARLSAPVAQGDEIRERLLEALTPHSETKAAYMGEFSWTEWLPDENGVEQGHVRTVPWTTIKEIMAAIRDRASVEMLDEADALATPSNEGGDRG